MLPTRDNETGKYRSPYPQGLDPKPLVVKVYPGMREQIKEVAGSDLSNWVRAAIAEKLERERQLSV